MKRTARSFGFAVSGLIHAFRHERNLQLFSLVHIFLCVTYVALMRDLSSMTFIVILSVAGGFFIVVELLNTALERLADTLDDCEKKRNGGHYHTGIKMTKDVAAAASLIALLLYGATFLVTMGIIYVISVLG